MKPYLPKNIIISHVYSGDNKGDAALTSVLISDLRRIFPKACLKILKLDKNAQFEGVKEQPGFMYYALNSYPSPVAKLLFVSYMIPATLLWAWWRRITGRQLFLPRSLRTVALAYAQADLIVAVGGGYIRSRKGLANRFNIPLVLHPLIFSWLLGKPTVLYPQSVGPFVNVYEPWMVAFVLRRMLLIILREDISVRLLARLGVTKNVVRSVDSGFLLSAVEKLDVRGHYKIPPKALLVGVTVRDWLPNADQKKYERAVAAALDDVIERYKARVLFIPQVTAAKGDDDRTASRRVHHRMHHKTSSTVINEALDQYQIKAIYNELDILLGTRFHSVIFSLTAYVPVLAIEYEHKTSGIMRDLGLEQWVVKIEHATAAKLRSGLRRLIDGRVGYRARLQKRLPPYVERAGQAADLMAEAYAMTK